MVNIKNFQILKPFQLFFYFESEHFIKHIHSFVLFNKIIYNYVDFQ